MAAALDALWRATFYGRETMPATHDYFFENRDRRPDGHCVIQAVEAGHVELRAPDGTRHLATAGHAFLFRYGEDSAYGFPAGNSLPYVTSWLTLEGAGIAGHWDLLRTLTGPVVPLSDGLRLAMRQLADLAAPRTRCDPTTMAAAVHAFVLLLISGGRERLRLTQPPVERAIDELLANPTAPWSLKELAERHAVSREHLTRAFQQRVGQPPATWLNQARVAKARHLLTQTDIAIGDVTVQAGFSSTHTMARLIKEATGQSPLHFRTARRGPA